MAKDGRCAARVPMPLALGSGATPEPADTDTPAGSRHQSQPCIKPTTTWGLLLGDTFAGLMSRNRPALVALL